MDAQRPGEQGVAPGPARMAVDAALRCFLGDEAAGAGFCLSMRRKRKIHTVIPWRGRRTKRFVEE